MRLFALAAVLCLATPAFSYTKTYSLSYDTMYDHKEHSLRNVTCSTGEHGLLTHGYKTFGNLPTFPYVGAAPQIVSWNSPYCGSCWEITYTNADGASMFLNFTAINAGDHGPDSFTTSLEALDHLTHGWGRELKTVPITATRKPERWCGLSHGS